MVRYRRDVTPAHAGGRITTRRDNGDGTFSDAVGRLVSHHAGVLTIERRDGRLTEVDESTLVAHKLITQPEHVTIGVHELERIAALGWVAKEHVERGGWLLRASEGFTGRGNSALVLDPDEALRTLEEVIAFHRERGLTPMVAIPLPDGAAVDAALEERGWTTAHGGIVMTTHTSQLAALLDAPAPRGPEVTIADAPSDEWLATYRYRGAGSPPPVARTLMLGSERQAFASVHRDGALIGIGRVAAARGWSGVTAVEVHGDHRRQGIGRLVMGALTRWALAAETPSLYLQVAPDNFRALAMYRAMGMHEHHTYVYRTLG